MGLRGRTDLSDYNLFFITTTCHNFLHLLNSDFAKQMMLDNLNFYNKKYEASTVAYVIMNNHFHLIQFFNVPDSISNYMRDFKKFTSVSLLKHLKSTNDPVVNKLKFKRGKQTHKIWMDRFDDLALYKEKTTKTKLDYIHNNPVKKGYCSIPEDYSWSSAKYYELNEQDDKIDLLHYNEVV